jgi:HK97 gp10 family phage protein
MRGTSLVWDEAALLALRHDPGVLAEMLTVTEPVVQAARAGAPHRTGLGAASIHAEASHTTGGDEVHISWERDRYYMEFSERGTRRMPARPFLVPAVDRYLRRTS